MKASTRIVGLLAAGALAPLSLVLPAAASAAVEGPVPHFTTAGVSHVSATTVELDGTVNPEGLATSYYFQYGPTTAYGKVTKAVAVPLPNPPKVVKVGQSVTGMQVGYHYRIVGIYTPTGSTTPVEKPGADKSFTGGKLARLKFIVSKSREDIGTAVYGGGIELTGSLTGIGNAFHPLSLQATLFPFTEPFTTLGGTITSTRTGSFVFKVARLTGTTQFRFVALAPRPVYSPTITVPVTPRITLHVQSSAHTGLYRLYGTVAPARNGAIVQIQQLLPGKARSRHEGPSTHGVGSTVLKRATSKMSRFSVIVKLSGNYRYRAFVKLPKGVLDSGHSGNVLIKAPKPSSQPRHKKGK
jgi:hypothetical protein